MTGIVPSCHGRQPAGASAAARATAIAPVGGRGSGETETERDEGSETHSQDGASQMSTEKGTSGGQE